MDGPRTRRDDDALHPPPRPRRRGEAARRGVQADRSDRRQGEPLTVLGSAADPDGRLVELTAERWEHILRRPGGGGHPELEPFRDEVMAAVEAPDLRRPGRQANEEWF